MQNYIVGPMAWRATLQEFSVDRSHAEAIAACIIASSEASLLKDLKQDLLAKKAGATALAGLERLRPGQAVLKLSG